MMSKPVTEPLSISAAAFTDPGRVRTHNEDAVAYHIPKDAAQRDAYGMLLVVADGVAGGPAGEIASEHAVRRILNDYYQAPMEQPTKARLIAAVQQANLDILQQNLRQPDARRMTTTVVAAVVQGASLLLVHAGDSRAYLARGGQIAQLTQDHSWVAEMVRSGDLTPAEAQAHPWRNRITRALGLKEDLDLDVQTIDLRPGDRIILCTDGLVRHVTDAEILDAVIHRDLRQAAQFLIGLANQRGGEDNVSVLVAEYGVSAVLQPVEPKSVSRPAATARPARRKVWWPWAIAGAVLILVIAVGAVLAARYLAQRGESTPPPPTATAMPPSPTPLPATTVAAAAPSSRSTPTATVTMTPVPSSTSRPTLTPTLTPTRTPSPTRTRIPTQVPSAPTVVPATPAPSAPEGTAPPEATSVRRRPTLIPPPTLPLQPAATPTP